MSDTLTQIIKEKTLLGRTKEDIQKEILALGYSKSDFEAAYTACVAEGERTAGEVAHAKPSITFWPTYAVLVCIFYALSPLIDPGTFWSIDMLGFALVVMIVPSFILRVIVGEPSSKLKNSFFINKFQYVVILPIILLIALFLSGSFDSLSEGLGYFIFFFFLYSMGSILVIVPIAFIIRWFLKERP